MSRFVAYSAVFSFLAFGSFSESPANAKEIDYNRDVRRILSDKCFTCHGPDGEQRQAGLRLDQQASAFAKLESGETAIIPGKPGDSELIKRILSEDEFTRMPPPESEKQLTAAEIAILKQWISEGGKYQKHWSFITPTRPELPTVDRAGFLRNPIDHFILEKLQQTQLEANPQASKETLIRRVTLDLTGLPPTIEEVDAFLQDESPNAYEKVVDRLLSSPRFGEHMARYWLDAARYGDTHGLHLDNERAIWLYREWVIDAFNNNKPFDEFTIEQLAGDLLPNPTVDQKIATGFNRCNVTTSEGGSIAQEYLVRYAVDRVETTSTVFMGMTMGCAVCHDHKYDPFTMTDFYSMFAYYYSLTEKAMDGNALLPPPTMKVPTQEQQQQMEQYSTQIAALKKDIKEKLLAVEYTDPTPEASQELSREDFVWIEDELPNGANPQGNTPWEFVSVEQRPVFSGKTASTRTAEGLSQHFFTDAKPLLSIGGDDTLFAYVYLDPENPPQEIMLQFNDGSWNHRAVWGDKNAIDWGELGTASRQYMGELPALGKWTRLDVPVAKVGLKAGSKLNGWAFTQFGGTVYWDKAGLNTITPQAGMQFESLARWDAVQRGLKGEGLPGNITNLINIESEKRNEAQQKQLKEYFLEKVYKGSQEIFGPLNTQLTALEKSKKDLDQQIPSTLIMEDMKEKRQAYVLIRGEYEKPDESRPVEPNVPAFMPPLPEDAPKNRLSLARWLVSAEHPLTSRVTVNRYWQKFFGTGLVKTAEDFGSQGESPSHPELLDWLAVEFRESGWDIKAMQKLIVMSGAYRQSSVVDPQEYIIDPENRLLARGSRFRLDAEIVRDNALYLSGLLIERVGGKSVKPYQPKGLWNAVGYTDSNTANFTQDHGESLYRRSMYTFWKRTSPPPTMSIFDAPSREACTVRRERTNTPMQALALMNDIQFVEAARLYARRIMTEAGDTDQEKIVWAFRTATSRMPDENEMQVIQKLLTTYREKYTQNPDQAQALLSVGESPREESLDVHQQAAWTMIANLILNLDETISKG
ncbi:PSD1 and planctomycete cytochrome C domain-containing protein [Planctomycetaceae bacterium]|nr:PSD1 and planctomycete cytochrome C domain-containing protein [Planctomycetaceae bacterium]MDG2388899.1 PSD1 and planctomycete cytochrome C domain-containing protein [Planctomycetaceae bacterium]